MSIYELTNEERMQVVKFLENLRDDSTIYYGIWLDSFRSLFDPASHLPMQIIKFYVLNRNEITQYSYVMDTHTTTFGEYRNKIIREAKNLGTLIGPHIPDNSAFKDMVNIIHIYNGKNSNHNKPAPNLLYQVPNISSLI